VKYGCSKNPKPAEHRTHPHAAQVDYFALLCNFAFVAVTEWAAAKEKATVSQIQQQRLHLQFVCSYSRRFHPCNVSCQRGLLLHKVLSLQLSEDSAIRYTSIYARISALERKPVTKVLTFVSNIILPDIFLHFSPRAFPISKNEMPGFSFFVFCIPYCKGKKNETNQANIIT